MSDTQGRPVDSTGFAIERRRPGRRNDVSPRLMAMMRHPIGDGVMPEDFSVDTQESEPSIRPGSDPISPARGIAVSVLLVIPLWCVVGGAVGLALNL